MKERSLLPGHVVDEDRQGLADRFDGLSGQHEVQGALTRIDSMPDPLWLMEGTAPATELL